MTSPKLVRASAAVEAPVPPSATAISVPVHVPVVIVPKVVIVLCPIYVEAIVNVGLPLTPLPSVTVILSAVPVIVRAAKVVDAVLAANPLEDKPLKAAGVNCGPNPVPPL